MYGQAKMSWEEMMHMVDEIRELVLHYQVKQERNWQAEQRVKASALLELLRRHLPVEVLRELKEFLSHKICCDCFHEAVQRDLATAALRETLPAERWGEIEQLVDKQVPRTDPYWPI